MLIVVTNHYFFIKIENDDDYYARANNDAEKKWQYSFFMNSIEDMSEMRWQDRDRGEETKTNDYYYEIK